ncbi:MAG: peptidoglycan-binding protein [Pseudomonadota bacterium]
MQHPDETAAIRALKLDGALVRKIKTRAPAVESVPDAAPAPSVREAEPVGAPAAQATRACASDQQASSQHAPEPTTVQGPTLSIVEDYEPVADAPGSDADFHAPVVIEGTALPVTTKPELSPERRYALRRLHEAARKWGGWVRDRVERAPRSSGPQPAYDTDHYSEEHFFKKERKFEGWTSADYAVLAITIAMVLSATPHPVGDADPDLVMELASLDSGLASALVMAPAAAAHAAPVALGPVAAGGEAQAEAGPLAVPQPDVSEPYVYDTVGPGLFKSSLRATRRFATVRYGDTPTVRRTVLFKSAALAALALPDPSEVAAAEAALALDDQRMEEVRLRLELAGLGPLGDGEAFDPQARSALARFQQREGISASGFLDGATLRAIEAATDTLLAERRAQERAARLRSARRAPAESPEPPKLATPSGPVRGADGCMRNANTGELLPGQGFRCDVRGLVQGLGTGASPERLRQIEEIAGEAGADR